MELHDQCAPLAPKALQLAISRERGLPPAPLPRGRAKSGRQGRQLACGTVSPARPASPLRELPPQSTTPRQRSAARPAPTLAFEGQSSALSRLFRRRPRVCRPSPRGRRNGRQGRTAGRATSTPCVAQVRLSRTRSFKLRAIINSYAPIIMRPPLPLFWELAFVMPQRDSSASALAPRLSPKARGL